MRSLQHVDLPFELKTIHGDGEENSFEAYAAGIGNIDHNGDRIMPGAFKKTIRERVKSGKVKLVDHHGMGNYGPPVRTVRDILGVVIEASEEPNTKQRGKNPASHLLWSMNKVSTTPSAQAVLTKIKEEILDAMSIGYRAIKVDYEATDETRSEATEHEGGMEWEWMMGRAIRNIKELAWIESSLVAWGMNDAAMVIPGSAKSLIDQCTLAIKHGEEPNIKEIKTAVVALSGLLKDIDRAPEVMACVLEMEGKSFEVVDRFIRELDVSEIVGSSDVEKLNTMADDFKSKCSDVEREPTRVDFIGWLGQGTCPDWFKTDDGAASEDPPAPPKDESKGVAKDPPDPDGDGTTEERYPDDDQLQDAIAKLATIGI